MTDARLTPEALEREVREVFEIFEGWTRGVLPDDDAVLGERWVPRLHPDFRVVMPGGAVMGYGDTVAVVHDGYGSNPGFRIALTNFRVVAASGSVAVVTYDEWQRGARSGRVDNGRISTVVFTTEGANRARWLLLQQTWMRPEALDEFPYPSFRS
jgi:hypothetical protein